MGKYEKGEDFRASIQDAESQKQLQDRAKAVKSQDTLERMIEQAREQLQRDPTVAGKVNNLADLLLQRGKAEDEQEAIEVLSGAYQQTGQYSFKMRADDVTVRQLQRKIGQIKNRLKQNPQDAEAKSQLTALQDRLVKFDIEVFKILVDFRIYLLSCFLFNISQMIFPRSNTLPKSLH